ncbi:MAG: RtcB family protein [Phycisphaerales bacterium]
MKARELVNLGFPRGEVLKAAQIAAGNAIRDGGMTTRDVRATLRTLRASPEQFLDNHLFEPVARALLDLRGRAANREAFIERDAPAPWQQWGSGLEPESIAQMRNAARLPVAVAGALMPDAHVGYGLPIGGVLATQNAVIPYAVGVDIACRMKLTVLDLPLSAIDGQRDRLIGAIETETRFGTGAQFHQPHEHDVMDDEDWNVSHITTMMKPKAHGQLGTSGSGNHFVEFGTLVLTQPEMGLEAGTYVALLSHSGSRGAGARIAQHFSKLAMELHPELPRELKHLAWLDLDSEPGQQYWAAMNLMGRYAAANHAVIHKQIAKHLGAEVLLDIENHHNFAWKETHDIDGQPVELIVHRKGATPAGEGVLGVIPGSMATPGYVVRGRGVPASLASASHGAGRAMSRTQARNTQTWSAARRFLAERNVTLISAGLDEVPFAYKDIDEVMSQQRDLVDVIARFDPRIVKMAPEGERPED